MKKSLFLLSFIICGISNAQPIITSFTPTSGPVGTTVTIIGTNFNTTPANNIVFFGATMATISTASTTSLTVTVPTGATYQYISVTDLTTNLTTYSAQSFLVTFPCGGIIDTNSFSEKIDSSSYGPWNVKICDLDGDGKSDLAVANANAYTISLFRNTSISGTISFAANMNVTTGTYSVNIAIGDLDGDGKPEIVASNGFLDSVSVFKNTSTSGTISFATKVRFATGSASWGVAIGDLDGDGKPDLTVADKDGQTVSVLRNTCTSGNISFATKVDYATGSSPRSVAIGDLDGDGKPDLAVANDVSNTVSVFRNTSTSGNISFAAKLDFATGLRPYSVVIGDLDGDGNPDLATANNASNTVTLLRNTSTGGNISFASKLDFATGNSPYSVAMGDLDGDGKPDIATANAVSNTVAVLKNTSSSGIISFAAKVDYVAGIAPQGIAIGDLDGDDKPDFVVANYVSHTVSVLRNIVGFLPTMTSSNTATICSGKTVDIPFTSDVPTTYTWLSIDNPNTTGESTTTQTTSVLSDVITNNSTSAQMVTYTVTPNALSSNNCTGTPQVVTVTVNPLPTISLSGLTSIYCYNSSAQILTGSPADGTFSGAGISGNSFTPYVAGAGTHTITYTYTDGNGCKNSTNTTTEVHSLPPTPSICLVSVDSLSQYNIIVWGKTPYAGGAIDTFIVYRELNSNNYQRIGEIPFDSLSRFIDTVRTKYFPYTGAPNSGTYRYKLGMRDTCGNYSAISPYHNTIYMTNNSGTFSWIQLYTIENASNPVSSYLLMRDDNGTGNYHSVNAVSGTQQSITDPAYSAYQNTATWRVQTQWLTTCAPTIINPKNPFISTSQYSSSKSNTFSGVLNSVAQPLSPDNRVNIAPNPSNGWFQVQSSELRIQSLEIYNPLGEKIYLSKIFPITIGATTTEIDLNKQPNGVYFVHILSQEGTSVKKIVINR